MNDVHGHEHRGEAEEDERVTSPMQAFSTREVGIGAVVLVVGLAVTVGLPLLLA